MRWSDGGLVLDATSRSNFDSILSLNEFAYPRLRQQNALSYKVQLVKKLDERQPPRQT